MANGNLSPKMQKLKNWLDNDLTNRGYAGMSDAQASHDMVNVEMVERGIVNAHLVREQIDMAELVKQWDADATANGQNAEGKRIRALHFETYLAGFGNDSFPNSAYQYCRQLTRRVFGPASDSFINIDMLLSEDIQTRHEWLGFRGETEQQMTDRIARVRAV